jgi:hypothetical protein
VVGRRLSGRSRPSSSGLGAAADTGSNSIQVPKLNTDPVWSLRPWPLVISVHGAKIKLPELCATDWLVYLLQNPPDLDGLLLDWLPQLEDLVAEQVIDLEEMYDSLLTILATVAARPWWVTLRLVVIANRSWDLLGPKLMSQGIDANSISLSAWLDALLLIILENTDPKQVTMFTMQLEAVPVTVQAEQDELEMDRSAFLSLMD